MASKTPAPENPRTSPSAVATLEMIAEQSGLSPTTISRVLSGQARRYRISKATETAVRQLAKEHNFVPNQLARGLRLKKTHTIGLIVPDLSNPFFAAIAHQVIVGARRYGYSVILCDSLDALEWEKQSLALLQSQKVEGVVLCPAGQSSDHLRPFVGGKLPLVLGTVFSRICRCPTWVRTISPAPGRQQNCCCTTTPAHCCLQDCGGPRPTNTACKATRGVGGPWPAGEPKLDRRR